MATVPMTNGKNGGARTLEIVPAEVTLAASQVVKFSVPGALPGDISWSVEPVDQGVFHEGIFIAPTSLSSPRLLTVTARTADGRSASAMIRLIAVEVTIWPSEVTLRVDENQQFTAFAKGDPANGIAWGITPGVGTITKGLYA